MTELNITTNDDIENNLSIQTSGADPAVGIPDSGPEGRRGDL